jgi:hypothetical protein
MHIVASHAPAVRVARASRATVTTRRWSGYGRTNMKKAFRIIVAMLLIGGWGLAASALHVVWTGSMPVVIPKNRVGVRDTYVNVAKWKAPEDVQNHAEVAQRLLATNRENLIAHVFNAPDHDTLVAQIQDCVAKGPTTRPADVFQKAHDAVETAKAVVAN